MNNKDLFNAIQSANEKFVFDAWQNTEPPADSEEFDSERPLVIRAEKRTFSVKKAAAVCAAAVVFTFGAAVSLKFAINGLLSASNTEISSPDIFRVRDVGFYTANWSEEWLETLGSTYGKPFPKDGGESPSKNSGDLIYIVSWQPPRPDIYYFNDMPLDKRMLSNEAESWLYEYCTFSENDRVGMTPPDEVRYLTGKGLVRFGDLGFFEEKYTEAELERIKAYCADPIVFSSWPPEPDVYYYNDTAYNLDQVSTEDAKNWLKWYCWLDDDLQEKLSGYVPEELEGTVTICNSEKPAEMITYKGKVFDVRSVSYDTELYIKWYNSLSEELQNFVFYAPEEISGEELERFPDAELVPELIGADGVKLDYKDLAEASFYKYKERDPAGGRENIFLNEVGQIFQNNIGEWEAAEVRGFVYLAENGSDKFKRYNVGDTLENGLTVEFGCAFFRRSEGEDNHALYYVGGIVTLKGTTKVDMLVVDNDLMDGVTVAVTGLPAVNTDDEARADGRIAPKAHTAKEFTAEELTMPYSMSYSATVYGDADKIDALREHSGEIVKDVEVTDITIQFMDKDEYLTSYDLTMYLP